MRARLHRLRQQITHIYADIARDPGERNEGSERDGNDWSTEIGTIKDQVVSDTSTVEK